MNTALTTEARSDAMPRGSAALPAGNRDNWRTPRDLRDAIFHAFNWPSLDVCGCYENAFAAGSAHINERQNGLVSEWRFHGRSGYAWCNPPGSQVADWVLKADREARQGNSSLVLVQQGLETDWYHAVKDHCVTLLLKPRPQFVPPPGIKKSSNPRNYMLLVFEPWMQHIPCERITTWHWKT